MRKRENGFCMRHYPLLCAVLELDPAPARHHNWTVRPGRKGPVRYEPMHAPVSLKSLFSIIALLALAGGCRPGPSVRVLYAGLGGTARGTIARVYLNRPLSAQSKVKVKFKPEPRGSFAVALKDSPPCIEILFSEARPFAGAPEVKVRLEGVPHVEGKWLKLLRGVPNPVLLECVWRDLNRNKLVDQEDELELRFSAAVEVVKAPPDSSPVNLLTSEFLLPEGIDQLGTYESRALPLKADPSDLRVVHLQLGRGVYFRPSAPGQPALSRLGFNASPAAPSLLIKGRDSGLGAVGPAPDFCVPIVAGEPFKALRFIGRARLGPSGGNKDSCTTFCKSPAGLVVVITGGREPEGGRKTRGDVFAFDPAHPDPLLWEGVLQHPRFGHAAVALPIPAAVPLVACVLVAGGVEAFGKPLPPPELICIAGREVGCVSSVELKPQPGPPPQPVMRIGARGVYVPQSETQGYALVTGGEVGRWGSVTVYWVRWNIALSSDSNTIPAPEVQLLGTFFPPELPARRDLTVTAVPLRNGSWGAFVYGGRVGDSSVGLPLVVEPSEARPGVPVNSFLYMPRGYVEEERYARHGHAAVYLPGLKRVVVLGGVRQVSRWESWEIPIDEAVEFDPLSQKVRAFAGTFHQYTVQPSVALIPGGGDRVLIAGGRDRGGTVLRRIDVYDHAAAEKGRPRLFAVGEVIPKSDGVEGRIRCAADPAAAGFYLVDPQSGRVWRLDLSKGKTEEGAGAKKQLKKVGGERRG